MKLTDIAPISSDVLNSKMREKLGWNIKTENLSVKDAEVMLESVNGKLNAVRSSSKVHASEKDPNYTGMLMAQQVLENYISEAKKAKNPYAVGMAQAMKSTGDEPPLKKSTIKKAHDIAKKVKANESTDDVEEGNEFSGALAAAKKAGKDSFKVGGKTYKVNEAELKLKKSKKTETKHKKSKKIDESIDAAIRRMINEDEVTQAQSVMAAKDMVDSLQGMLEDISKMVNEELPPLTDSIRSNIGDAQATSFQSSVQQTLNDLLSQVQGARESVNNAVLGLTGQAPAPVETPSDMGAADLDAEEPADDFGASDAAVGGELPLGREKRV